MRIDLVPSGVEPVDALLGGVVVRQICLVTGAPRTGKTAFAISFLAAALARGEGCCLVTTDSPESVLEFSEQYFELDLKPHLRDRTLSLLNFGLGFENKIRSLGSMDKPFGELGRLARERGLQQLVIDSLDPVLAATTAANLKQFIRELVGSTGQLGLTCLWTILSSEAGVLTPMAEELASQVACVLDLRQEDDRRTLEICNASWCTPDRLGVPIQLVHGQGIVATGPGQPRGVVAPAASRDSAWRAADDVRTVMMGDPSRETPGGAGPGESPSLDAVATVAFVEDASPPPAPLQLAAGEFSVDPPAQRPPPRPAVSGLGDVLEQVEKRYGLAREDEQGPKQPKVGPFSSFAADEPEKDPRGDV